MQLLVAFQTMVTFTSHRTQHLDALCTDHSCTTSVIAARSSACAGSSCSRLPRQHATTVSLTALAVLAAASARCHLCSAG